jgi:tetratricopeptide (TPR) repeat protein
MFQRAIAKYPGDPVAHFDLGTIYQQAGDRRSALREYKLALLANSRYVPALFNTAILMAPNNAPLAIFDYRQVIQMQPRSPTAFLNVGLLENQTKGSHKQALSDLSHAVALDPSLRAQLPARLRSEVASFHGGAAPRRRR